jgi:hypothetical protein
MVRAGAALWSGASTRDRHGGERSSQIVMFGGRFSAPDLRLSSAIPRRSRRRIGHNRLGGAPRPVFARRVQREAEVGIER